ncbi:MAG: hypothetical protein JKY86_13490 [Gammaproteobacteria bacterium]|nr:hypothetical protein [Gammaproteobacteria bacterium]
MSYFSKIGTGVSAILPDMDRLLPMYMDSEPVIRLDSETCWSWAEERGEWISVHPAEVSNSAWVISSEDFLNFVANIPLPPLPDGSTPWDVWDTAIEATTGSQEP